MKKNLTPVYISSELTTTKKSFMNFLHSNMTTAILFPAIMLILSFYSSNAQVMFEKEYGTSKNEYGRDAAISTSSGYAITGFINQTATNRDICLLKVDTCGRLKVSRTYGGSKDDLAYRMVSLTNGTFAVAGETQSWGHGLNDAYLLKIAGNSFSNVTGRAIGDTLIDVGQDLYKSSAGYIITGYTKRSNGKYDVLLAKFDNNLVAKWNYKIGGTNDDQAFAIEQITGGDYIIAGGTLSYGAGNLDVYLIRTNTNGIVQWTKTYGTPNVDVAYNVKQTLDGGFLMVGKTKNSSGNSGDDILLVKTSSTGILQWVKSYGGMQDETGEDVIQLSDSSYVVVGFTKSFGKGNYDVYLFKVNKNGAAIWARTFGGTIEDEGFSIRQTPDNGFLLCGHTKSFGPGNFDVYLMKTNSLGYTGCNDSSGINTYSPHDTTMSGYIQDTLLYVKDSARVDTFLAIDSIHCSNCTPPRLLLNPEEQDMQVFPNPADNFVTITGDEESSYTLEIEIYNSLGILVYHKTGIDPTSLHRGFIVNTQDWRPGLYFVRAVSGKQLMNQKLLISK